MKDDKHYPDCYYCTQYIRENTYCTFHKEHKCYGDWCEYGVVDKDKVNQDFPKKVISVIDWTCSKCGEVKNKETECYRGLTCKACHNKYLRERYIKTKRACVTQSKGIKYRWKCIRCHHHTSLPALIFMDYNGDQIHINFKGISLQRALDETILSLPICKNCYAVQKFKRSYDV